MGRIQNEFQLVWREYLEQYDPDCLTNFYSSCAKTERQRLEAWALDVVQRLRANNVNAGSFLSRWRVYHEIRADDDSGPEASWESAVCVSMLDGSDPPYCPLREDDPKMTFKFFWDSYDLFNTINGPLDIYFPWSPVINFQLGLPYQDQGDYKIKNHDCSEPPISYKIYMYAYPDPFTNDFLKVADGAARVALGPPDGNPDTDGHFEQGLGIRKDVFAVTLSEEPYWFWDDATAPGGWKKRQWLRWLVMGCQYSDTKGENVPSEAKRFFAQTMYDKYRNDVPPADCSPCDPLNGEDPCAVCLWNETYPDFQISSFLGDEDDSLLNSFTLHDVIQACSGYQDYQCPPEGAIFLPDDPQGPELNDGPPVLTMDLPLDLGAVLEPDDGLAFMEVVADSFYARTTRAVRTYDPNHLIMSERSVAILEPGAGPAFALQPIMEIATKYCDVLALNLYVDASNGANAIGALSNLYNNLPLVTEPGPDPEQQKRPIVITEFSYHADGNNITAKNWGFDPVVAGWDNCWPERDVSDRCDKCPLPGSAAQCTWHYPNVIHDPARGTAYSQFVYGIMEDAHGNGGVTQHPQLSAHFVPGYFWYSLYDHEAEKVFDYEQEQYEYGQTTQTMQNWGLLKLRTNAPATTGSGGLWETVGAVNGNWQCTMQGYMTSGESCN